MKSAWHHFCVHFKEKRWTTLDKCPHCGDVKPEFPQLKEEFEQDLKSWNVKTYGTGPFLGKW